MVGGAGLRIFRRCFLRYPRIRLGYSVRHVPGADRSNLLSGYVWLGVSGLLALRFGAAAVRMVADRKFGVMVALDPPTVLAVPLEVATERMKCVPLDSDTVLTARDLGISFGDKVEEE